MQRRDLLGLAAGAAVTAVARAATESPATMALAWTEDTGSQAPERYCIGTLLFRGSSSDIGVRVEVPSRAHGLCSDGAGQVLSVARRPGLWLMRWSPKSGQVLQERWAEPGQQFNGHVLCSPDGRMVLTSEIDPESGAGCIVQRDPRTLAALERWPSHGLDPHQMLWVEDRLYVANGGIRTRPETGRAKLELDRMDSSLVALDMRAGRGLGQLLGQWRVTDARLSLRHLAWHAEARVLGIAMQAEHTDATERERAPVLALFDGKALRCAPAPALAGYGGDIAATGDGFFVSAPRADGGVVVRWDAAGQWRGSRPLAEACALAAEPGDLRAAGLQVSLGGAAALLNETAMPRGMRVDNHWQLLPPRNTEG